MNTPPISHKTAMIAGALIANLLYIFFLALILLTGRGREFLVSQTRWSSAIAAGLLAAIFGSCLGGFFIVTNDVRKQDEKTALMLASVFNGAMAVGAGLFFARLINFNWSNFLNTRPQASALLGVVLLALVLMGVGLLQKRREA